MPTTRRLTRTLAARRRAARAALALAGALVAAGVLFAIGAKPFEAAERIRPLSELVDAAFSLIRGAGRVQLVVVALLAVVLYALAVTYLGERWRAWRRRGRPPE